MNRFIVSFVDKSINVTQGEKLTVASIKSGFKFSRFDAFFEKLGFKTFPEFVNDILENYGYKKDYKNRMYATYCTGTAKCSPEDEFDEVKGRRIAVSRAKKDGYNKALGVAADISRKLFEITAACENTIREVYRFDINEDNAIKNVIKYGVSNPTNK